MTLVHTVNDAMTAILGALLPTLQVKFDAGPTALALLIAVFWIASSVTQPVFGALGEDIGLRVIGCGSKARPPLRRAEDQPWVLVDTRGQGRGGPPPGSSAAARV